MSPEVGRPARGSDTTVSSVASANLQSAYRVSRSETVIFTEIGDTIVMMDCDEGRYYELNPCGARIWALVESESRVADISEALISEYAITPEACAEEVGRFLGELNRLAVVQVRPPDESKQSKAENDETHAGPAPRSRIRPEELAPWATPTIQTLSARATRSGDVRYWTHEDNFYSPDS